MLKEALERAREPAKKAPKEGPERKLEKAVAVPLLPLPGWLSTSRRSSSTTCTSLIEISIMKCVHLLGFLRSSARWV